MTAANLLERLEARALMDSAPLPTLAELESVNNPVVRFETNYGDIDIELFPATAPITVANFLKYVRDGDYDKTFFHRLAHSGQNRDSDPPFVLQGGLARLTGTGTSFGAREIPTDPRIQNEFGRTNAARTLAMAKLGSDPNSATSQFFFNLANNASNLDMQNGGFTVFARVANDRSWQVVQDMINLNTSTRRVDRGAPYDDLPVRRDANLGDGFQEDELVTILDAEVIKPQGVAAFYTRKYYFPEGFAGGSIKEFIPIGNPGASTVHYQVVVRAEVAQTQPPRTPNDPMDLLADPDFWYRDKLISTGTVPPNSRRGITVSDFENPEDNLVDRGVPYAVEVWATGPLSVNMSHYDFGAATGESFTDAPGTSWVLPEVRKGGTARDFVLWQNTSDAVATVTVEFFFGNQPILSFTRTTEQFRRGGLSVNDLGAGIPDGVFSMRISSAQPITASVTRFDTSGEDFGSSTLGIAGEGATAGVLALGNLDNSGAETLSFLNRGSAAAVVTLTFSFSDGTPDLVVTPPQLIVAPGRRSEFDLSTVGGLAGKRFSVRYSSGASAVYASTVHRERGDDVGTAFVTRAATEHGFAEGFIDHTRAGVDVFETISLYNPNTPDLGVDPGLAAAVTLRFLYTDGTVVTEDIALAAGGRRDVDVHALASILGQAQNNGRFFFSIEVVSDVPIVAQMRHYDLTLGTAQPSGGFMTSGLMRGIVVALTELDMA